MQNILLNFQSDTQGVEQGIEKLDELAQKDSEVEAQARKTMKAYEDRDKSLTDSTKKSAASLDKISKAFSGLDKSIAGGAYTKALKQLQTEIGNTGDEFKQLSLAVDFAKKKMAELDQNSQEFQELSEQVAAAETVLHQFGDELKDNETKAQSFRTRLREMKQSLLEMEEAGLENSNAYRQMALEAAKLEDQIGDTQAKIRTMASDTFVFDALIQGITGVTAAFSIMQGAQALIGDESEDMQKALLKVNAAMALLQGLQQIQNVLEPQSALMIAATNIQRKASVLYTNLQSAAESKNIIVRYAAIVAQRALNVVMSASPAGLLLTTFGAIAAALVYFTANTDAATRAQNRFNGAMKESGDLLNAELKGFETANKKIVAEMKERGASDNELSRQEINNTNLRIKAKQQAVAVLADTLNDEKTINELSAEDYKKLNDKYLELQLEIQADQAEIFAQRKDLERQEYLRGIKSAQAYAEARVLTFKQGSREELKALQESIRLRAQAELSSNPNLTAGERTKILQQELRDRAELQFQFDQKSKESAIEAVQAKAALAKQGSREQLDFELTSLELEKQKELQTDVIVNGKLVHLKELTEKQKAAIDDKYLKLQSDKVLTFSNDQARSALNERIAFLNASIAPLAISADAETNRVLLEQKKQLIDEEARLEILGVFESVHNEEERTLKIKAIRAKQLADKIELEKAMAKAEIDYRVKTTASLYDREAELIKRNNDLTGLSFFNKTKDAAAYYDAIANRITGELAANDERRSKDLISEQEYLNQKRQLNQQADDNEFARRQDHQRRINAIRDLATQAAVKLLDFEFGISQKHYAAQQQRIQQLYDQKKISETEYNNQLKVLRKKQDKDAKAQALFQTLIQEGPTILKGFQQGGFAGVAAAFTLFFALLSAVQSAEEPQYAATGKILIDGPGSETSDSIPLMVSRNESVIRADMSKKHTAALRAINENRYEDYLKTVELPRYMPAELPALPGYVINTSQAPGIDYDKLGEVVAQKLAENPHYTLSFDERGFTLSIKQGQTQTDFINKKLTT